MPDAVRLPVLLAVLLMAAGAQAADRPADFVALESVDASIRQDIRYHGKENFLGSRVTGYEAPRCLLTRPAAEALARVQAELRPQGLSLKLFDCFRPQRAVDHFMRWARSDTAGTTQARYYPNLSRQQLLDEVYIAGQSGHSRGSTVDLTLVPAAADAAGDGDDGCTAAAAQRGGALDMGTGFDCFDPRSHTASGAVTPQQRANRLLLKLVMERQGFANYPSEWWHYTLRNEPHPDRYFDFPLR